MGYLRLEPSDARDVIDTTTCPECGSNPGNNCRTRTGRTHEVFMRRIKVHFKRVELFNERLNQYLDYDNRI